MRRVAGVVLLAGVLLFTAPAVAVAATGCVYSGGGWICHGTLPPSEPREPIVEPDPEPVAEPEPPAETPPVEAPAPEPEPAEPAPVPEPDPEPADPGVCR